MRWKSCSRWISSCAVSEAYHRACATARALNATAESSAEYTQAVEQYRRAVWLLRSLQFREQTLRQIAEYAADRQRAFLDTGQEHKMKMLTRTEVAAHIGKQVSTVSRAIANKFVLLPNGELVPLAHLFAPAVAPEDHRRRTALQREPRRSAHG